MVLLIELEKNYGTDLHKHHHHHHQFLQAHEKLYILYYESKQVSDLPLQLAYQQT